MSSRRSLDGEVSEVRGGQCRFSEPLSEEFIDFAGLWGHVPSYRARENKADGAMEIRPWRPQVESKASGDAFSCQRRQ